MKVEKLGTMLKREVGMKANELDKLSRSMLVKVGTLRGDVPADVQCVSEDSFGRPMRVLWVAELADPRWKFSKYAVVVTVDGEISVTTR
ncbi:MAG: hypothetical protein ACF8MF_06745 [Phycisphaerales bacterium JB052]